MKLLIVLGIIAVAILARFVPHIPNAVPITAIAIFAGAYLPKKYAFSLTFLARFISDLIIGFFSWPLMIAVYGAHLLGVGLGLWIKDTSGWQSRWIKIGSSSLVAAALFFLITNFAFLYGYYPHTWAGIVTSYVNALPFLRGTVIGDVGYTVLLFGVYELAMLASRYYAKKQLVRA